MKSAQLVLPNQLFENSQILSKDIPIFLIEEFLFFKQFNFHKQKIFFHRDTMKNYSDFLSKKGFKVYYVDSSEKNSDIRLFLSNTKIETLHIYDPEDNWLKKRITKCCSENNINLCTHSNPLFLTNRDDLEPFFNSGKKKLFQTTFYKSQRKKYNILLELDGSPTGGKWTYDDMNREKFPKNKNTPYIEIPKKSKYFDSSIKYVEDNFSDNLGVLSSFLYPTDFKSAKQWFNNFLETRFDEFGIYEDAVLKEQSIINHSVLSPLINCGLLEPDYVVKESLIFSKKNNIPINSVEGFIRQIIGWREFIRGVYYSKGTEERLKNFWGFKRKIPKSFYDGTTGIEPVDDTIKKVLRSGYANHIERLMILGNFMVLCEFDPDDVYKWFMELFIDSYDWVMVPNVYGMSQYADGGIMSTKPYISSSNYICKMSDYKKGDWSHVWDGLFWNFMDKHREFFLKNPRMRMLVSSFDKMDHSKKETLLNSAFEFLNTLDK